MKNTSKTFEFTLKGDQTTHRFTWNPKSLLFLSQEGLRTTGKELGQWLFQPENAPEAIAQKPMLVLLNLWLFQGHAPTDDKEIEIIALFTGVDETFGQNIYARNSYVMSEILWDHRFEDILGLNDSGHRTINFARFHRAQPLVT